MYFYQSPVSIAGWIPSLKISAEKVMYALCMLIRVFSLSSMTILIPYCLNPAEYGVAFHGLGLPDSIAFAMDLTMRLITTYGRDFTQTMEAQRARGYETEKLRGGLLSRVRKLAPLFIPVTLHAILDSEDIINAMDLRAFGTGPRTWLVRLKFRRRDWALIIFGLLLFICSLGLVFLGYGKFWVPNFLILWTK